MRVTLIPAVLITLLFSAAGLSGQEPIPVIDTSAMTFTVINKMMGFSGVNISSQCVVTDRNYLDSNIIIHFRAVEIPGGWPHLTDSVPCYWDTDTAGSVVRGFDSLTVCPDGICDSVTKLWAEPHRYWGVGTPYGMPGAHPGACEEDPNVFCSDDFMSWSFQIGSRPGDIIANPIYTYSQLDFAEIDSFYYHDPDGPGGIDAYPIDTGSVGNQADSAVPGTMFTCLHLADPDIFLDAKNRLWVVWMANYGGGFYHSAGNIIWAATSSNGFDWSEYYQITHMGDYVSPAVIADGNGTYHLYVRNGRTDAYHDNVAIYRFSTDSIESKWPRSGVSTIDGNPTDLHIYSNGDTALVWHFDIIPFAGERLALIYSAKNAHLGTNDSTIGFCVSDDFGANFNCISKPLWHRGGNESHYYAPTGYFMGAPGANIFRAPITYHDVVTGMWRTRVWDIVFNIDWTLGDADGSGGVNIADGVFLIRYLFNGGTGPSPLKIGDLNASCAVDVGDAVYLLNYVFRGGPAPLVGCEDE